MVEGDNAVVFSSCTPDLAVETAHALHARVLRAVFACVGGGEPALALDPSSAVLRVTLSYVDLCMEHLFDMLSLPPYVMCSVSHAVAPAHIVPLLYDHAVAVTALQRRTRLR